MELRDFFKANPRIALAFSGGVDSAYLLYEAVQSGATVRAYYVKTAFQPRFELEDAERMAGMLHAELKILDLDVLSDPCITGNPSNRCYYCKRRIFSAIAEAAQADGFRALIDGTNASDDASDRPGMQALKELNVLSPLRICGLTKQDIRQRSRAAGLFTWDKPAYACLATRIPTATPIAAEDLIRTETAEDALRTMGFTDFRVRLMNGAAKLQMPGGRFPCSWKNGRRSFWRCGRCTMRCCWIWRCGMNHELRKTLEAVRSGELSVEDAARLLKTQPFEDLGFAKVDLHRKVRQGAAEVIYGAGKTAAQIVGIVETLRANGQKTVLVTRLSPEKAGRLESVCPLDYHEESQIGIVGSLPVPDGIGKIVVATGGTSDIPVAEEAALTAEALGNEVVRLYDVGVAGLHRLLAHLDELMDASVIIAIAGMEGALASVIGGLADCPVIAVPTSVGYGASFGGVSALLSMLNSCASGVSVVNIDNGFGAGYQASMINHMEART